MRLLRLVAIVALALLPRSAAAHDDPVLTVRVLSQGLTDGQIDTAMGEVDDNATINVDQQVSGRAQIIKWMQRQLQLNLRIEVIDVRPTQTADGYDVTWTTHMYREDWRKAGVPMRQTTEHATIHNGRITQWTSSLSGAQAQAPSNAAQSAVASAQAAPAADGPKLAGVPLSQVPIGLVLIAALTCAATAWFGLTALRRPRRQQAARSIEALAPRAVEQKR